MKIDSTSSRPIQTKSAPAASTAARRKKSKRPSARARRHS